MVMVLLISTGRVFMSRKITGHVISNLRRPMDGVIIHHHGKVVAKTDENGYFAAKVSKKEERSTLSFFADGYVQNTQVFKVTAAGNGNTIVVWPVAYRILFDPASDMDVELGGARICIYKDTIVDKNQKKISGKIQLSFTLFDVTDQIQRAAASGDFSGKMLNGSFRRLNSYGIFQLEIRDQKNRSLMLKRGAKIDLSIPVPVQLANQAPEKISYFDLENVSGSWVEVGAFEFDQKKLSYNGSVTSFGGVHNLDDPQDTVCVTIRVVRYSDSMPIPNANVTAGGLQYSSTATTNVAGYACLLVQRNAQFSVTAYADIGTSHYATISATTFSSPNFSSGAGDCGDPNLCPFLGNHFVDLAVG